MMSGYRYLPGLNKPPWKRPRITEGSKRLEAAKRLRDAAVECTFMFGYDEDTTTIAQLANELYQRELERTK